jgi:hypothetical protein
MKGKLFKTGNDYLLKDTNGEVLAITNGVTEGKKLSKQNCDEIFGVVYVEKLADEYANVNGDYDEHYGHIGFKAGFKKAIELNKDKVFTEEDLTHIVDIAVQWALRTNGTGETYQEMIRRIYQSFREPTEIEVEIGMDDIWDGLDSTRIFPKEETSFPRLDPNGCLILKKI